MDDYINVWSKNITISLGVLHILYSETSLRKPPFWGASLKGGQEKTWKNWSKIVDFLKSEKLERSKKSRATTLSLITFFGNA